MFGNRIKFVDAVDIAAKGEDGFAIELRYTLAPIDSPSGLETGPTNSRRLRIRLSRTTAATWTLSGDEARAVMLDAGFTHLLSVLRDREPGELEELIVNPKNFAVRQGSRPGRETNETPADV